MNIDQMEKICMDEGIDVTQLHAHITDERNRNELMGSVFKVGEIIGYCMYSAKAS